MGRIASELLRSQHGLADTSDGAGENENFDLPTHAWEMIHDPIACRGALGTVGASVFFSMERVPSRAQHIVVGGVG